MPDPQFIYFYLGDPKQTYKIPEWTFKDPECKRHLKVNYMIPQNTINGDNIPNYINVSPLEQLILEVFTNNMTNVGEETTLLVGAKTKYNADYQNSTITVIIKGPREYSLNLGPPYFISPLENVIVELNKPTKYNLPDIKDPDDDDFTVKVNFGNAFTFIKQ